MRFDDRLATALGQMAETPAARQAVWRQLVDVLGQSHSAHDPLRSVAFGRLRSWRAEVSPASRQTAAIMLAGHEVPVDLVEFFAEDLTAVAAPLLACVTLAVEDWLALIPRLSPVARALLRHRRDLPEGAVRLLEAYGPADLVIPAPAAAAPQAPPEPAAAGQDIQALRARIDALRDVRERAAAAEAPPPPDSFDYEAGPDGVIRWCDLPQRGALVGLSIAEPAPAGREGVDGQAAGAFRHRSPFRNSRLWIAEGPAAGDWSLAGVPSFDPGSGRFLGYRGSARRPRAGERADRQGLLGLALTGDSARQFAHEMRTPLNAIAGFAEMIQRQMLGPANIAYRQRAAEIMAEAGRIGAVLDELEDAARLEAGGAGGGAREVDCALLLARVTSALEPIAADKGALIALTVAPRCAAALVDPATAERLAARLVSTSLALAAAGERLQVEVAPGEGPRPETCISVSRPDCVAGMAEQALFDACDVDGADGEPPLGLGFSLRYLRHAAEACGGRFAVDRDSFRLFLPSMAVAHGSPAGAEVTDAGWSDRLRRPGASPACHDEPASAIAADPAGPVAQR